MLQEIESRGPKIAVTTKLVRSVNKKKNKENKELYLTDTKEIFNYCGKSLLAFNIFPSSTIPPLCIVGDLKRLSESGPIHADFTFITNQHSFFCLSERIEYAYPTTIPGGIIEGRRGFTWCYAYSKMKDTCAIELILTTIKTQIMEIYGNIWSPPEITIDFDQRKLFPFLFYFSTIFF